MFAILLIGLLESKFKRLEVDPKEDVAESYKHLLLGYN